MAGLGAALLLNPTTPSSLAGRQEYGLFTRVLQSRAAQTCRAPAQQILAQSRDVQAGAAPASTRGAVQWPEAQPQVGTATPLDQLPEPEGEFWIPFVGETAEMKRSHFEWAHKRVKKYGPVFKSNIYGQDVIVVADFPGLQKIFGGDHSITQWMTVPSLEKLTGNVIMQANKHKETHLKQRRQQGAAFTPDAMDAYLPRVVATCREYLDLWAAQDHISLVPAMTDLSFDFAESLVVGLGVSAEEKAVLARKWAEFSANACTFMVDLPGTPYNRAKQARDYILGAIRERVEARKAEYLAGSAKRDTLLSWFASAKVADGDPLDIEELSMQVLMLMFAGSDTSRESHKVLLGILPDLPSSVIDNLRQEQARIVAKHGPEFGRAAMAEMRYADACAREVLRIWGTAEMLFRTAKEDFELHGKRIRKGQTLMASILYAKACDPRVSAGDHADVALPLHMDIHQLHASFRPERWLNKANNLDQAALGTFGMGIHSCLGAPLYMQEAKVLLALIARGFDVRNVSGPVDWGVSPQAGMGGSANSGEVLLKFTPHQYV